MPGGESRPAPGLRNLGWHRASDHERAERLVWPRVPGCYPEAAFDVAEGAPTPPGGFLPVQRKLDAPRRAYGLGFGRSEGCARGLVWLQKSTSDVRSERSIGGELQAYQKSAWVWPLRLVLEW